VRYVGQNLFVRSACCASGIVYVGVLLTRTAYLTRDWAEKGEDGFLDDAQLIEVPGD
jgi:ABC-type transport system involved in cytochrome c biogenesis permease component